MNSLQIHEGIESHINKLSGMWGLSTALMSFVNVFDLLKSPLVQAKDYIASIGGNEI
jgi:hypothetical protein